MKKLCLLLSLVFLTGLAGHSQEIIVSSNGIGPIPVGMALADVPASLPPRYTSIQPFPEYFMWVYCNKGEDSTLYLLGEDEESDQYETFVHFILHSPDAVTKEGLHVGSTCKEILEKGGKMRKKVMPESGPILYVELDDLYFFFDEQEGVERGRIKPDAPCEMISNSDYPFYM